MRSKLIFTALLLLASVFLFGNIIAEKGGVMDKAILNKNDPYYQMDQYVKNKAREGFEPTEFVIFELKFPNGINSKSDLEKALAFNEKLEIEFGDQVMSLAQIQRLQNRILGEPYLHEEIADIEDWKNIIKKSKYYGVFINRDFSKLFFTLFLEPDYDEIKEFQRIGEFLEERKISELEWWHKTDIYPKNPNIGVAGWVVGRGLIDLALTVDILKLVALGLILTFPIFILSLRSWKQAVIATLGIVFMSLIWTRGSIGLMQFFGIEIKERVYVLLAYANCIVQGVSFSLHKFESINKKTKVNWLIGITALIAIGSFGTLYWFQALTIRELGIISATGVGFLFVLAVLFLPALNALFKAKPKPKTESGIIMHGFDWAINKAVSACAFLAIKLPFAGALATVIGLVLIAGLLIYNGNLIIKTNPLEFIQDTLVHRTAQDLNQEGEIGFDFIDMLVESKTGIYNPLFIQQALQFQQDLGQLSKARETSSILDAISEMSFELFNKPIPAKSGELHECFFLLENSRIGNLQEQFWYDNGIRVSVSARTDDSNDMSLFNKGVLDLARNRYPDLKISLFGKLVAYPQVDRYIRLGKPWNVLSSQWVVILFCFVFIFFQNKKTKSKLKLSALWGSIIMSVPFVFASAVMALIMMIRRIPLDIATAAMTALAINASIDFSIYFVAAYQEGLEKTGDKIKAINYAMQDKGKIIIEDMILNSICFAPLLTSHFLPVQRLGWIMSIMLLACGIGALIIMPAMLAKAVKGGFQDEKVFVWDNSPAISMAD